jgi:hypothetical protein
MNKDEKTLWIVVRVVLAIIMTAFIVLGFIVKPNPVEATLWEKMHPAHWYNILGVILFMGTAVGLSGLAASLMDTVDVSWNKVLFGLGIVGFILLWV